MNPVPCDLENRFNSTLAIDERKYDQEANATNAYWNSMSHAAKCALTGLTCNVVGPIVLIKSSAIGSAVLGIGVALDIIAGISYCFSE